MSKYPIFDLEQEIMQCWSVVDDIDLVVKYLIDSDYFDENDFSAKASDEVMNKVGSLKDLYEVKFHKLWETFEKVTKEYHEYRKQAESKRIFGDS